MNTRQSIGLVGALIGASMTVVAMVLLRWGNRPDAVPFMTTTGALLMIVGGPMMVTISPRGSTRLSWQWHPRMWAIHHRRGEDQHAWGEASFRGEDVSNVTYMSSLTIIGPIAVRRAWTEKAS